MGGGAPSNTKQQVTQELPAWAKPYAGRFLDETFYQFLPGSHIENTGKSWDGKDEYRLVGGELAPYGGPLRSILDFTDLENLGRQNELAYVTSGFGPLSQLTDTFAFDTLSGKYLNPDSNPYLAKTYDRAARGVTQQYRDAVAPSRAAEAARAGAFGGTAHANAELMDEYSLNRQLSDLANSIYGENYARERDRQLAIEQFMPTLMGFGEQRRLNRIDRLKALGADERQLRQAMADVDYENALTRYEYPIKALQQLGALFGIGTGNATSQTSIVPNPNAPNAGALYGGLGIAGASTLADIYGKLSA